MLCRLELQKTSDKKQAIKQANKNERIKQTIKNKR